MESSIKALSSTQRLALLCVLIFSFSLIIFRGFNVSFEDRKTLYGDGYSDENTWSAILFFKDHGFKKSYLRPMHNYTQTRSINDAKAYTHYPALPDILSGLYAVILDTNNEALIRIPPTILSLIMLIFVWLVLQSMIFDQKLRVISFCGLLLSNYFISYADSLHKHIYEEFLKWSFLCLLIYYYKGHFKLIENQIVESDKKTRITIGLLLSLVVFLAGHSSFEPITYIAVTVIGFSWVFERKVFTPLNVFLGLASIGSFISHLYLNALYLGSWDAAISDITNSLNHRTLGKDSGKDYFTFVDFFLNIFRPLNRAERMFLIPGWAYAIFCFFGLKNLKKQHNTTFKLLLVLLLASYSWAILMPQHSFIHPFTVRQFGIFITLSFGLSVYAYYDLLKIKFVHFSIYAKSFHCLLIAYTLVMILTQHVIQLYLKFGFLFHFRDEL